MKSARVIAALIVTSCVAAATPALSQSFSESVTYSFCSQSDCNDGSSPSGGVVQGANGDLYGTASNSGADSSGTAFQLSSGTLNVLHAFCSVSNESVGCVDGAYPSTALTLANNGMFYGTNGADGSGSFDSGGTVFEMTASGGLTTLYSFCSTTNCDDGQDPNGSLIQGSDGSLYGTTQYGGTSSNAPFPFFGEGTVYRVSQPGTLISLYSFCTKTGCPDGDQPIGPLAEGADGNYYGTTSGGGKNSYGTVFKITPSGTLTTIYSFCNPSNDSSQPCPDGGNPLSGLLLGTDGNFYGTTSYGGANGPTTGTSGEEYGGTVFKITPAGALTTLYSFCETNANCSDGSYPVGVLIQATDGNFYGATQQGGTSASLGTVLKVTPSGALTTIHTFCMGETSCTDGQTPYAGLTQATNGTMYGTTYLGGANSFGTVYSITGLAAKKNASIAFAATPYPPSVGQTVTLSATVSGSNGTANGTVIFSSNGVNLCGGVLSGGKAGCTVNTSSLPPGSYPVLAQYSGGAAYNAGSTSVSATLDAAPTATTLMANPTSLTPPASVKLTATVKRSASGVTGTPTGSVSFLYGSDVLATVNLSKGVAVLDASTAGYSAGTYGLTARYNGDASDAKSTSAVADVTLK